MAAWWMAVPSTTPPHLRKVTWNMDMGLLFASPDSPNGTKVFLISDDGS
uniref:Uncharacterized protein n=1 Tax=Zea mays TaxID=4577 RepID=C4J8B4_MAIZE|nr:unknown [Zea mays]